MAFFEDDFETYTVGDSFPFGSWQSYGSPVSGSIIADGFGKAFRINTGFAEWNSVTTYRNSFSIWMGVKTNIGDNQLIELTNGPNIFGNSFGVFSLKIEPDGTVTASVPGGQVIKNSHDFVASFSTWNFFQINLTLSDWDDSGTMRMQIDCSVGLNGQEIINHTLQSTVPVALMTNGTAEVNRFALIGSRGATIDNFTIDSHASIPTFPHIGTPVARIPSGIIEIANLPDSAKILTKSGIIEIAKLPSSAKVIVYAGIIELLLLKQVSLGLWKVREI